MNIGDEGPIAEVLSIADRYRAGGRYAEAERVLLAALKSRPRNVEILDALATVARRQGRNDDAIAWLRQAVDIEPDNPALTGNLGNVYRTSGMLDEAIGCYRRVLEAIPDSVAAHNNLGLALKAKGDPAGAAAAYRRALAIDPQSADPLINLGAALLELNDPNEAASVLRSALTTRPDSVQALTSLASACAKIGDHGAATAAWERASSLRRTSARRGGTRRAAGPAEVEPDNPRILEGLGYVHFLLEEDDEARRIYERVLAMDPDSATARHIVDVLDGKTTRAAPRGYVEALFDGYAENFDNHMVSDLSYTGPGILVDMLSRHLNTKRLANVLDLGCGTGLMGQALKGVFRIESLTGVDVSAKMIAQAARKNVYSHLTTADILDYLHETDGRYELVTAADVFIYIGDLAPIFEDVRRCLTPGGRFCLTVEATDGEGYALLRTARYAHSLPYVDGLCVDHRFNAVARATGDLRRDAGRAVIGHFLLLQRD